MIPHPPLIVRAPIAFAMLLVAGAFLRVGCAIQDEADKLVPEFVEGRE